MRCRPDPIAARAFVEGLFARHHGEIYAYLIRMLRDPELAADLAQDAFIRAYRGHASLEDPTKAAPGSTRSPTGSRSTRFAAGRSSTSSPGRASRAGPRHPRSAWPWRRDFSGELERALGRIPRAAAVGPAPRRVHELTGVELATSLGTSHVAARALLTRARESLRRALAEERVLAAEAEAASARSISLRRAAADRTGAQ